MLEAFLLQWPHPVFAFIRGGYLAVTTFFVLSGFVLARNYCSTPWTAGNLLHYWTGRVARVYPVYVLSLTLVAPFIVADSAPSKAPLLAAHGLLLQGWLGAIPVNWNTPAWSLSCEIFFYGSFPLIAAALHPPTWRKTLAAAMAACLLTRALWALGVSDQIKPLIHLSDFLMGVAAACAFDLVCRGSRRPPGAWLYLPACGLAAALIARPELLPSGLDLNTALRPLNALLLVGFALGGGLAARALSSPPVVYLGKSSYAMYILHVPLLWWCLRWPSSVSAPLYLSAVVVISALVYRFVEEPANRWVRSRARAALHTLQA